MAAGRGWSRRGLGVVAVVVALVAAGGAGATWWLLHADDDEGPSDEVATGDDLDDLDEAVGEPQTYEEDREEADRAATLLTSLGDDTDVAEATAPGTLENLDGVEGALPPGARVEARPETWLRRGNIAVMVVEVTPDGADEPDRFATWLVRHGDDEGWVISATELLTDDGEDAS